MKLEDLQQFCSVDPWRTGISKPFSWDNHTYATDGRILIRTDRIEGAFEPDLTNPRAHISTVPPLPDRLREVIAGNNELLTDVIYPPGWQDIKPEVRGCHECGGKGHFKECRTCKGFGYIECECCEHQKKCQDCDGHGQIASEKGEVCEDCNGTGEVKKLVPIALNKGEVLANQKYLKMALSLPGAKLFYRHSASDIFIKFDEGLGCLMPVTNDNINELVDQQWRT